MTCFAADVLNRAPLTAEEPHSSPYGGGKRRPIEAPHRERSLAPY